MKFKQLKEINQKLKAIDVKGKGYIEVNQRILGFREMFPNGSITTEILTNENGVCVIKAIVINDSVVLATGHAYEKENSTFINKTSYIENCETSAVGRALGILGIGAENSIVSAEEVKNAMNNQNANKGQLEIIKDLINTTDTDLDELLLWFKIEKLTDMTFAQAEECRKILDKKIENKK